MGRPTGPRHGARWACTQVVRPPCRSVARSSGPSARSTPMSPTPSTSPRGWRCSSSTCRAAGQRAEGSPSGSPPAASRRATSISRSSVPDSVTAEKLDKAIRQGAGAALVDLALFDVYRGPGVAEDDAQPRLPAARAGRSTALSPTTTSPKCATRCSRHRQARSHPPRLTLRRAQVERRLRVGGETGSRQVPTPTSWWRGRRGRRPARRGGRLGGAALLATDRRGRR